MPSFRGSRWVRHTAMDMFDLVADFERYPEFVPHCRTARITQRSVDASGIEMLIAEMGVGMGSIHRRFVTSDVLDRARLKIVIHNFEGPFRRFESAWTFRDDPSSGCSRVQFATDYDFESATLGLLLGSIFDAVFSELSQAFAARADAVYRQGRAR